MEGRLTVKEKMGYASAAFGDAAMYGFVGTFLLFYLTTVAGIQPAAAGTITILASLWDGIFNPVVGYLSDHCRNARGRRRTYMLGSLLPLMIVIVLLFTKVDLSDGIKTVYYGCMTLGFWSCFTLFFVPYYALGVQYTSDYNERTVLRSYASFMNSIGVCFCMVIPSVLVKAFEQHGLEERYAWSMTAVMIAILSGFSIFITYICSKDKDPRYEPLDEEETKLSLKGMLRGYLELLKLGPVRWVLLTCLFALIANGIFSADMMYYLTYNMGLEGVRTSGALLIRCLFGILLIPVFVRLCGKFDKRRAQIGIFCFGALAVALMRIVGTGHIITFLLLLFFISVCVSSYWQILPSITYDLCEYDEYVTGQRRAGSILSFQALVESVAAGIGTQILGIILQIAGFNGGAAVQSAAAEAWIFHCTTWVPAVFVAAAMFCLSRYPISRKVFEDIQQKLAERKAASEREVPEHGRPEQ